VATKKMKGLNKKRKFAKKSEPSGEQHEPESDNVSQKKLKTVTDER